MPTTDRTDLTDRTDEGATEATAHDAARRIVVTVRDRFDASTVPYVRVVLHAAVDESDLDVGLHLPGVAWLDAAALALLADTRRRLRARGRTLVLTGCDDQVRRVLAVTRLSRLIPVEREAPAHAA